MAKELKQVVRETNKEFGRLGLLDERQKLGGFVAEVVPVIMVRQGEFTYILPGNGEDITSLVSALADSANVADLSKLFENLPRHIAPDPGEETPVPQPTPEPDPTPDPQPTPTAENEAAPAAELPAPPAPADADAKPNKPTRGK